MNQGKRPLSNMLFTLYEGTQIVRKHLQNLISKHSRKISAAMMVSKLLSVIVIFAFMPIDTTKVKAENEDIAIRFDQTKSQALVGKDRQVAIASGDSAIELAKKSSTGKIAYAGGATQSVERDPAYFRDLYMRAGAAYGVPWQLIEAVHYVETGSSDSTNETSYAGATGPMQFMPGTWRTYGVDGNGDGSANITDVNDAIYGAANLLAQSGAAEGNIDAALFNYNHAQWYVDKVKGIAQDAGM